MKLFEITDPYFAIIAAENKEKCMEFYEKVVCDVEDKEEFLASVKELESTVAITKVANTVSEETKEPVGIREAEKQVLCCMSDKEPTLLALDGFLM
ncbi:hypothetical protein [Enterococcus faecium]|uniref:Uncharacterized protein n=1 Tax=Enterococcus faecium TaxID=1352 RepID=A0A9X4B3X1_ENTFC|nr:hypothetical protein [Enterococcus faecium]MDC4248090.1 hypothetical protein [Enterococcus faecium]